MNGIKRHRIESIDLLRGVVMILMALDHARMYFGYGIFYTDPTDLSTTTPLLFLTRWITHFCAPVFVFLAGTGAFLYGSRERTTKQVSWFLFSRGLWLLFLEMVVINFGWNFDIGFGWYILQVIWAIGFSMVCLSAVVFLPKKLILIIGLIVVFGHNLLDSFGVEGGSITDIIWYALHQKKDLLLGRNQMISVVYPVLPWIGLMFLGYVFGEFYKRDYDPSKRRRALLWMGIGAVAIFAILRVFNLYGDPGHWAIQKNIVFSIMSFFNATKYPPSLLFLLMTIGPAMIFLALTENCKNKIADAIIAFGRVPLFFYVLHIYFIHLISIFGLLYAGYGWNHMVFTVQAVLSEELAVYGFGLPIVYIVWIIVIVLLFPLCRWYNNYKTQNRGKWWLSYL